MGRRSAAQPRHPSWVMIAEAELGYVAATRERSLLSGTAK